MQFKKAFKERIARGELTVSYRLWRRAQASVGKQYNIRPFGAIEVTAVDEISASSLTDSAARRAGFTGSDELLAYIQADRRNTLTRVRFRYLGSTEVNQPDRSLPGADEVAVLAARIDQMDSRSKRGPWAFAALRAITAEPGRRAGDLAADMGWETTPFKANVRRLKALGLTISLDVGYTLSERGHAVLSQLESASE